MNCYFDGNSFFFIQVRKFRESRKENTEEEDEEVREVTPLNFEHRLKNGMVASAYEWSHLAILQHCPCQKVPVCLGKISKSSLNLAWYNMCLSYCSIWLLRPLFLCKFVNLNVQLFLLWTEVRPGRWPSEICWLKLFVIPSPVDMWLGCIAWYYWNKLVLLVNL